MRRLLGALAIVAIVVVGTAAPAFAHGPDESNYRTRITAVEPATNLISVRVIQLGSRVELSVAPGHQVTVIGYENEPYLRIGPDGIFQNTHSPATWLNRDRYGTAKPPDAIKASDPPVWVRVGSGWTASWHDHRTHWMSTILPPVVAPSPGRVHVITPRWTIPLLIDNQAVTVVGDLTWVPAPSALPWLLGAAAVGVVTLIAVRGSRHRRWFAATGPAVLGLHIVLITVATTHLPVAAVVFGAGSVALLIAARRVPQALSAAGIAVGIGAFTRAGVLHHTFVRCVGGIDAARGTCALALGIGFGTAAAALAGSRFVSGQQHHQLAARPRHAAANGPDRAATDLRGLGVAEAEHLGEHERETPVDVEAPD